MSMQDVLRAEKEALEKAKIKPEDFYISVYEDRDNILLQIEKDKHIDKNALFDFYSKLVVKVIKKQRADNNKSHLMVALKDLEELRDRYK